MKSIVFSLMLLALAACTSSQECTDNADANADRFERCDPIRPVNEQVMDFNLFADRNVIGPVAHTYHEIPKDGRQAIDHFLTNLSEPGNMVNSALQANPQAALTSMWRFILNTTFGLGGLRDFAGENGLKYNDQDFGKTLGTYGVADGAYVVLPVAGPSTMRDTTGKVVDWFLDPVGWYLNTPASITQDVAEGIDERDQNNGIIKQFYYQSIDPYAATRAAYLQHQAFQ